MALTLEQLFAAYTDESKDFAEDIYDWFGKGELGMGAEEFKEKYGMYLPTYDVTAEKIHEQDRYLDYRNAAETQNLAKQSTDRVYSEEMEKLSTTIGSEVETGREISGSLGLRSGSLEEALSDTLTTLSGKGESLGDRLALQREENTNTYNAAITDATLDYEKDVNVTKQEFYDRVMASVARIASEGGFSKTCPDESKSYWCEALDKCVFSQSHCDTPECPQGYDICNECGGSAVVISECEGTTEDGNALIDPDKEQAECETRCGNYSEMWTSSGQSCVDDCKTGGSQVFNLELWYSENVDDISYIRDCIDNDDNWICMSDDPRTEEVEGDEDCYGCTWQSGGGCGISSYTPATGWSFTECPDDCCPE